MDRYLVLLERYRVLSQTKLPEHIVQASRDYWARAQPEYDRLQKEYHSQLDGAFTRSKKPAAKTIDASVSDADKKLNAIEARDPREQWLGKRQAVLLRILERVGRLKL